MSHKTHLSPFDIVHERMFTHPEKSREDMLVLQFMIHRLVYFLSPPNKLPNHFRLDITEDDGRHHRLVITDTQTLLSRTSLTVVGFFGQKRPIIDHAPLNTADEDLIQEFYRYPGLLSYCTLELETGSNEYGNLVLFRDEDAKAAWHQNSQHAQMVHDLAPKHYDSIRLHNALLTTPITASPAKPILLRTKYYQFQKHDVWQAIREFPAESTSASTSQPFH